MSALAPELRFLLSDWLGLDAVLARPRHAHLDLDAIGALAEAAERLAREHLAPHAARSDAEEPKLVDGRAVVIPEIRAALDACRDAGFFGLDAPLDEGVSACRRWRSPGSSRRSPSPTRRPGPTRS